MSSYRSRQDINIAAVSQSADDLRRLCAMTAFKRALDGAVGIRGLSAEHVPLALTLVGLSNATAVATLLPNDRRWLSRVVHYQIDGVEVARWQSGRDTLLVLRCPPTPLEAYPYARAAAG